MTIFFLKKEIHTNKIRPLAYFWYDRWFSGKTLKDHWPSLFNDCINPWITVCQFSEQISSLENPFHSTSTEELSTLIEVIPDCSSSQEEFYSWPLEKNGIFSVKFFYKFLINGGIRCPLYSHFWKLRCPSKITLFC